MNKREKETLFQVLKYNRKLHFWTILYWDIFCPHKSKKLLKYIMDGMSWEAAFNRVKIVSSNRDDSR